MGVFTQVASNIKGFAPNNLLTRPVWTGPETKSLKRKLFAVTRHHHSKRGPRFVHFFLSPVLDGGVNCCHKIVADRFMLHTTRPTRKTVTLEQERSKTSQVRISPFQRKNTSLQVMNQLPCDVLGPEMLERRLKFQSNLFFFFFCSCFRKTIGFGAFPFLWAPKKLFCMYKNRHLLLLSLLPVSFGIRGVPLFPCCKEERQLQKGEHLTWSFSLRTGFARETGKRAAAKEEQAHRALNNWKFTTRICVPQQLSVQFTQREEHFRVPPLYTEKEPKPKQGTNGRKRQRTNGTENSELFPPNFLVLAAFCVYCCQQKYKNISNNNSSRQTKDSNRRNQRPTGLYKHKTVAAKLH